VDGVKVWANLTAAASIKTVSVCSFAQ